MEKNSTTVIVPFDSLHRWKIKQILLANGLPKETIMLYKNKKEMGSSHDDDIDIIEIVTGVFEGHILAPYLFMICLDYIQRTSIDLIKIVSL